ncbi:tetratricopeptide repeat protein [Endomicrobium proavitum]|uniref:Uncharacterized protein n=1 Tax=Endomicrobium proavitum TaxID=1408281 RepID=A0A0G3WH24_9BACT|nr:tetratricopeptide repeat protein [Endomicrobium proavitum]AKL97628.1 exported protein of unknown function [Endomicrobium proavitum]
MFKIKKSLSVLFFLGISVSAAFAGAAELEKALSLLNENKTDAAIEIIKGQIQANPNISDNYLAMGLAQIEKNDYSGAKENFQQALSINKKIVAAHYMLAMIYEKDGDAPQAIDKWQKIIKYSKNDVLKDLAKKHIKQLQEEIK